MFLASTFSFTVTLEIKNLKTKKMSRKQENPFDCQVRNKMRQLQLGFIQIIAKYVINIVFNTKNTKYNPYTITTFTAAENIKAAAKEKNEVLFKDIEQLDLLAKEFTKHTINNSP